MDHVKGHVVTREGNILDSGTNAHLTNENQYDSTFLPPGLTVQTANGHHQPIKSRTTLKIGELKLPAYFVPGF